MPFPLPLIHDEFRDIALRHAQVYSDVRHAHKVIKGELVSVPEKRWIKKTVPVNEEYKAYIELLGQEFFRLLIPHQPETRLFTNKAQNEFYILSEEVIDYESLPEEQGKKFTSGEYTGLGQVVVGAMFLQEIDLKNGNVGLNASKQVIKIDGDFCFSGCQKGYEEMNFRITPDSIARLPFPRDYYAFNWLDTIQNGMMMAGGTLFGQDLVNAKPFRDEVNQALLKISLLTNDHIACFVRKYMPEQHADRFIALIQARRDELWTSAQQNVSFVAYCASPKAKEDEKALLNQVNQMIGDATKVVSQSMSQSLSIEAVSKIAEIDNNLAALLGCKKCGNFSIDDPEIDRHHKGYTDLKETIVTNSEINAELRIIMLDNLAVSIAKTLESANSEWSQYLRDMIGKNDQDKPVQQMLIATLVNQPLLARNTDDFRVTFQEARDIKIPEVRAVRLAENARIKAEVQAGRPSTEPQKKNEEVVEVKSAHRVG